MTTEQAQSNQTRPQSARPADASSARVTEHFSRLSMETWFVDVREVGPPDDPLGYNWARLQAGEADAVAGRVTSFGDVMNGLRARIREHGH
jgi:hypothetical protein